MRDVRRIFSETSKVKFVYGCSSHLLNNWTMENGKIPWYKSTIKSCLYIIKAIKNMGLLKNLFEGLCEKIEGKVYSTVLYSPIRWTSVNLILTHIQTLRIPINLIPHVLLN